MKTHGNFSAVAVVTQTVINSNYNSTVYCQQSAVAGVTAQIMHIGLTMNHVLPDEKTNII